MLNDIVGSKLTASKLQCNELILSDNCKCYSRDNSLKKSSGTPQQHFYSTSISDDIKTSSTILNKFQMIYIDSEHIHLIRSHISWLISDSGIFSNNPNVNFQVLIEELCKQMMISEFEFICICTYFKYFSGILKDVSINDFLVTTFLVIKSKIESNKELLQEIKHHFITKNLAVEEKIGLFLEFEIDLDKVNAMFAYYRSKKDFKVNYSNYVCEILRSSAPYTCKARPMKYRKNRISKGRKPKLIKRNSEKINVKKVQDEISENQGNLKLSYSCISPFDFNYASYEEKDKSLYLDECEIMNDWYEDPDKYSESVQEI